MQVTRINIMWKDADINSVSYAFEDGITDVYSVNYSGQPEWDAFTGMFDYLYQVPVCNNIALNLTPVMGSTYPDLLAFKFSQHSIK